MNILHICVTSKWFNMGSPQNS
ncbi:tryptophanase leader peptide, partial [Escherichia coli]